MKSKIAAIILVLVCFGLGVALVTARRNHAREKQLRDALIRRQSLALEEHKQGSIKTISNYVSQVLAGPEKSDTQGNAAAKQLRIAQAELAKKDQKINELETSRVRLGKQMDQLTNSIEDLEIAIAATARKLNTPQGEKNLLARELARLRADKAELERQFNNLAVMRAKVSKLKEEMAISRRLEFMRLNLSGVTTKGGAQRLMTPPAKQLAGAINYDLLVQINQNAAVPKDTAPSK